MSMEPTEVNYCKPLYLCFDLFCSLCSGDVPGVLTCSSHVEKGGKVAGSVSIEQPVKEDGCVVCQWMFLVLFIYLLNRLVLFLL